MLAQYAFDFGSHGLQIEGPQSAGKWIRSLRENGSLSACALGKGEKEEESLVDLSLCIPINIA